jgi:hypothetical protein
VTLCSPQVESGVGGVHPGRAGRRARTSRSGLPIAVIVRVALSALLASGGWGCALQTGPVGFESLAPVTRPYSRNLVVCAPTAVGNYAGALVGGAVSAPFAGVAALIGDGGGEKVVRVFATVPALLVGGITGLPFLPVSYLFAEKPCGAEDLDDDEPPIAPGGSTAPSPRDNP